MANIQRLSVLNFQIPAEGLTDCMAILLPDATTFPPDGYTIDWPNAVAPLVPGAIFIPQAVTIDTTGFGVGVTALFSLPQIGFNRTIPGGRFITFQFPSLRNLVTRVFPSDGTSSVPTFWYNYPALPDCGG